MPAPLRQAVTNAKATLVCDLHNFCSDRPRLAGPEGLEINSPPCRKQGRRSHPLQLFTDACPHAAQRITTSRNKGSEQVMTIPSAIAMSTLPMGRGDPVCESEAGLHRARGPTSLPTAFCETKLANSFMHANSAAPRRQQSRVNAAECMPGSVTNARRTTEPMSHDSNAGIAN